MSEKPTYEELQQRIQELESAEAERRRNQEALASERYFLSVVLDTLQKNVETRLRQSQKIESVGRLAGGVAHLTWKPGLGLRPIKADASQIDQILAKLSVNARDAINGLGKLTIETGKVRFDEAYCAEHPDFVPGDFVLLAVSDDGCGMDTDTQNNLFEPFFTTISIKSTIMCGWKPLVKCCLMKIRLRKRLFSVQERLRSGKKLNRNCFRPRKQLIEPIQRKANFCPI